MIKDTADTIMSRARTRLVSSHPFFGNASMKLKLIEDSSIDRLLKKYTFQSYAEAMEFTKLIADLAESEGHHPKITLEWGLVSLEWWSHKIKGLHLNDFICAAKSDEIYRSL